MDGDCPPRQEDILYEWLPAEDRAVAEGDRSSFSAGNSFAGNSRQKAKLRARENPGSRTVLGSVVQLKNRAGQKMIDRWWTPISRLGLPNWITLGRLILAAGLFLLLSLPVSWRYVGGFALFVLASGSDWVDGFLARRFGMVTVLGRVLDPFVDKILVCGTLIFLAAEPAFYRRPELLQPWMVVIILARELLVTALRSWVEEQGHDFSAQPAGKLKMVIQSIACAAALLYLALLPAPASGEWLYGLVLFSVWAMVGVTIYSGVVYVFSVVAIWAKTGAIR
jgi:CDP-diacylglycerol--glycerol-3-phosphate 3-phosphatidyltransferase